MTFERDGVEEERAQRLAAAHEQARAALELARALLLEPVELHEEALGAEVGRLDHGDLVLASVILRPTVPISSFSRRITSIARPIFSRDSTKNASNASAMPFGERAAADGVARAQRRGLRRFGIEEPLELVGVAVVGGAKPAHHGARLLDAPALHARLLREDLDELLVLALQRRELLELLVGEAEAARR